MDFSPKIPTKGEISDPIAKYITPKMPEAAPAPPRLKLLTTLLGKPRRFLPDDIML